MQLSFRNKEGSNDPKKPKLEKTSTNGAAAPISKR